MGSAKTETPITERRRLREVHRYCTRFQEAQTQANLTIAATKIASPNTNLTALMQLIAWRLSAQHAMVSVVDENEQYFLAESTRTLDLEDPDRHDDDDGLWVGCGSTLRSEALCANTIEVPREPDKYACFYVTDLANDPRFCHLPYVAGSPHHRSYIGTPLVTKLGAPIGSVFVIDRRPRSPPTPAEVDFLGIMARNVMEYLEMKRGKELLQRNDVMSRGLAALVEGESKIPQERTDGDQIESCVEQEIVETPKRKKSVPNKNITGILETLKHDDTSGGEEQASRIRLPLNIGDNDMTHERILARAANLLRESLDADYAVFFETNVGFSADSTSASRQTGGQPNIDKTASTACESVPATPLQTGETASQRDKSTTDLPPDDLSRISSFATREASSLKGDKPFGPHGFQNPCLKRLGRLLRKYPTGKLWALTVDGKDCSYEDDNETVDYFSIATDPGSRQREAYKLLQWFPRARQVLFAPLWEAGTSNEMAACFIVSLRECPDFRSDKEPAFVQAFLNSVSVECSRVTIAAANQQKGDFISSISHELRSPLHGIIASIELLSESRLDGRQKEHCDTIETCGRVLLKTIMDVLDYTKINNVSRERRKAAKNSPKHAADTIGCIENNPRNMDDHVEDPLVGTQEVFAPSVTDVAKLCEDSVNVVATAHRLHTRSPDLSLHRVQPQANGMLQNGVLPLRSASVNLVLNIRSGSWNFLCLPGAIQRIFMNLAGNSLKYTQSGLIQVDLFIEEAAQEGDSQHAQTTNQTMIVLKVSDTGKGITGEFLRTKIFTPFSQESTLAPGTGLGLNMVKSLVDLQRGTIDIESKVGKGTTVLVKLPMVNAQRSWRPPPLLRVLSYGETTKSLKIKQLNLENFELQGFDAPSSQASKESVERYLIEWFNLSKNPQNDPAKIVVVHEEGIDECLFKVEQYPVTPQLIIVCHQSSQEPLFQRLSRSTIAGELLTMPFGPDKLAKVLSICLSALDKLPTCRVPNSIGTTSEKVLKSAMELGTVSEGRTTTDIGDEPKTSSLPISEPQPSVFLIPNGIGEPLKAISLPSQELLPGQQLMLTPPLDFNPSGFLSNGYSPIPFEMTENIAPRPTLQKGPSILCVDDNPINMRLLKTYMGKLHYTDVVCAENGAIAFDAVRRRPEGFDLIFMDLSMPVCDGFEAISLIRILETMQRKAGVQDSSLPKPSVIVALTGLAAQRDRDAAVAAGADHYVMKPLKFSSLKDLLSEWGIKIPVRDK